MSAYIMTLTQAGLAALVNVQTGTIGPVEITEIGLTDTQFVTASTLEALPGEIKRLDVMGDTLGDDVIHVEALDTTSDAYGYTGFALYTSTGLLFAVYGQADVIAQKAAGSASHIAVDIQMAQAQAGAITFGDTNFLNPPATTESQGVVELATLAEAKAGKDDLRVLTPATALGALLAWLLTIDGSGSKVDADLLDSQEGAWYTDIASRLGYVPSTVPASQPQRSARYSVSHLWMPPPSPRRPSLRCWATPAGCRRLDVRIERQRLLGKAPQRRDGAMGLCRHPKWQQCHHRHDHLPDPLCRCRSQRDRDHRQHQRRTQQRLARGHLPAVAQHRQHCRFHRRHRQRRAVLNAGIKAGWRARPLGLRGNTMKISTSSD
jgi:hypothetical protein